MNFFAMIRGARGDIHTSTHIKQFFTIKFSKKEKGTRYQHDYEADSKNHQQEKNEKSEEVQVRSDHPVLIQ